MAETIIDIATWSRAPQFHLFRSYARPQYAMTTRLDVTTMLRRKGPGFSTYRACLYAIGAGLHAVPALLMRFRDDVVVQHDAIDISMTVPQEDGNFGYAYVPWEPDFAAFDRTCADLIAAAAAGGDLAPNTGQTDAVAYASCLPWLDYTSINNAMPGPEDCIPRVSWGKFVDHGDRQDMAMTLEAHHALVDGAHMAAYFAAVQDALDAPV